jgi:hypothetical protein
VEAERDALNRELTTQATAAAEAAVKVTAEHAATLEAVKTSNTTAEGARASEAVETKAKADAAIVALDVVQEELRQCKIKATDELTRMERLMAEKDALAEERLKHERGLKDQEHAAAEAARAQASTLNALIEQVRSSTTHVQDLQGSMNSFHTSGLESREQAARAFEARSKETYERAVRLQEEAEKERTKLQETFGRMEVALYEQRQQAERDKHANEQELIRVRALQAATDADRQKTMTQLEAERARLQMEREGVAEERRTAMAECYEERRSVARERIDVDAARRAAQEKVKRETTKNGTVQAELEAALNTLQQETAELEIRTIQLRNDREGVSKIEREVRREQEQFEGEKRQLATMAQTLEARSREIAATYAAAAGEHEQARSAADHAEMLNMETSAAKASLNELQFQLTRKERELFDQRLAVSEERRVLHELRNGANIAVTAAHHTHHPSSYLQPPSPPTHTTEPSPTPVPFHNHPHSTISNRTSHHADASVPPPAPPTAVLATAAPPPAPASFRSSSVTSNATEKMRQWNAELDRDIAAAAAAQKRTTSFIPGLDKNNR